VTPDRDRTAAVRCRRRHRARQHAECISPAAQRHLTRHRFGSALNHHVHLHACVTDGIFVPAADHAGCDAPPTFPPARPITAADLAALTERVPPPRPEGMGAMPALRKAAVALSRCPARTTPPGQASANHSNRRRSRQPAARPPTPASSCEPSFDRDIFQASPDELPGIDIRSL